jgi:hypothetical protein
MDRLHHMQGAHRERLESLLRSRGMSGDDSDPLIAKDNYRKAGLSYGFWGANEDLWLGGHWARGRARRNGISLEDGRRNFCAITSGARGFLGGQDLPQELSIQLHDVYPCCATMRYPAGDARRERVSAIVERLRASPIFRRLNEGNPYGMGEELGVSEAYGRERADALRNVCLWCDEFMERFVEPGTLAPRPDPGPEPSRRVTLRVLSEQGGATAHPLGPPPTRRE